MIFMSGVVISSIATGIVADIFGRKKVLMICVILHIGSAFGSAFVSHYVLFLSVRFLVGFSCMGMYATAFIIGLELVGPSQRVTVAFIIEVSYGIGLYMLCILAYCIRLWDKLQLAIAGPAVLLSACIFMIPESPRWLKMKGRHHDANRIIHKWATAKGVQVSENDLCKEAKGDTEKESVLKMLTIPNLLIRTLIIYLNWFVVSMVYYGLSFNVVNLNGDLFVNFAINSSMEMTAYIFGFFTLNKVGRKPLYAGSLILGGAACLSTIFTVLYADKNMSWITVVLSNVGKLGVTSAHCIIYVWTAELFPTKVRNSGIGSSTMISFVGSIVSPYIVDMGKYVQGTFGKVLPPIIFGSLSIIAGLLSLILPETNGTVLPETVQETANFGKDGSGNRKTPRTLCYIIDAFNKDSNISEELKAKNKDSDIPGELKADHKDSDISEEFKADHKDSHLSEELKAGHKDSDIFGKLKDDNKDSDMSGEVKANHKDSDMSEELKADHKDSNMSGQRLFLHF